MVGAETFAEDLRAWATLALAVASLLSSALWPGAVIIFLFLQREPIGTLIRNIREAHGPAGMGFTSSHPENQPARAKQPRMPLKGRSVTPSGTAPKPPESGGQQE